MTYEQKMETRTMGFGVGAPSRPKRLAAAVGPLAVSAGFAAIGVLAIVQAGIAQPIRAAQDPTTEPAFEVASIKPSECRSGQGRSVAHGNLAIQCYNLRNLTAWAYGVPEFQVIIPASAVRSEFDIFAKAPGPAPEEQVRLMLRTLLAKRFKLTLHHDAREGLQSVMTRGKDSARLKPSDSEGQWEYNYDGEKLRDTFKRTTMAELTQSLYARGSGLIIDRTGLTGRYDFVLNYGPFIDASEPSKVRAAADARVEAIRALGLKVEKTKISLDFLIVDHVEKVPTED